MIQSFQKSLGEATEDTFWRPFLRRLRRYRFEACAAPLPLDHPVLWRDETAHSLERQLADCEAIYPAFAKQARDLLAQAVALSVDQANPLMDALADVIGGEDRPRTAVALKEPRLIPATESELAGLGPSRVQAVSASQLRGSAEWDILVVIGPARWFPEYVFSAPRAPGIHVVQYEWIGDGWNLEPSFLTSVASLPAKGIGSAVGAGEDALGVVEAQALLPKFNWDDISARGSTVAREASEQEEEEVEARLFVLEGGWAVFLDADETSSALVIDLEADEATRIGRSSVDQIGPGMHVLLRTEGGGDYIVPVADQIMGSEAPRARESQELWKRLLREVIKSNGLHQAAAKLTEGGALRASEGNVRHWASRRSIRTQDYSDFAAIMHVVGLSDKADQLWKAMAAIDSAHRKAGFHIRKLLLRQVLESDVSALEKLGRMDFELGDVGGGTLTAFRIVAASDERFTVPVSRLGDPFELEEDEWLG
jgi:hypothetical protein